MLSSALDWKLFTVLRKQLIFPSHKAQKTYRPDLIIFSNNSKKIIIWELSISCEDDIILANERKREKYRELIEECEQNDRKTNYGPIEVGCRGFVGDSLSKALEKIGIVRLAKKKPLKECFEAAERVSRWIWIKRNDQWSEAQKRNWHKPKYPEFLFLFYFILFFLFPLYPTHEW